MTMDSRTRQLVFLSVAMVLAFGFTVTAQEPAGVPPGAEKVDDVRVFGCLKLEGSDWLLTNATDPTPNRPPKVPDEKTPSVELPPPPPGRNQFKLIGVDVFHLPNRVNQRLEVTGLLITAKPMSRINITTVVPVAPSCEASGI